MSEMITRMAVQETSRSVDRADSVKFRMRSAEKAVLKRDAAEAGLTVQQLLELRVFGQAKPIRRPGPVANQEELQLQQTA
jgi:hypothetical protein